MCADAHKCCIYNHVFGESMSSTNALGILVLHRLHLYWHMERVAYATLTINTVSCPLTRRRSETTATFHGTLLLSNILVGIFVWYFRIICDTWTVFEGYDTWMVFDWCETWKRYRNIVSNDFIFMSIYLMATKPRTMKATAMDAFKQKESRDELHPNICIPNAPLYCLTRYWLSQVVVHWVTLCAWRLRRLLKYYNFPMRLKLILKWCVPIYACMLHGLVFSLWDFWLWFSYVRPFMRCALLLKLCKGWTTTSCTVAVTQELYHCDEYPLIFVFVWILSKMRYVL